MNEQVQRRLVEIPGEVKILAPELSKAQAEYHYLENKKKVILAVQMGKFEGSVANREMLALQSQKYQEHLEKIKLAEVEYIMNKTKLQSLIMGHESCRSLMSLYKTEANIL